MANFSFTPSPAAQVTARVEKATSHLLVGPDWAMNMDICDIVNNDHWQAKDVIRAIKKRLQNKNPKVQFLTLTLLETVVKNCGDYVHSQVVEREILQDMMRIVRKKMDMQVREKILELLDSWQEAFGGPGGKYPQYYWAYVELKRSGVAFPRRSRDNAPVFTPPAHSAFSSTSLQVGYGTTSDTSRRLDETMASETGNLSLPELKNIRIVMELFADMLQAVNPYERGAVKDDLISELVNQCRSNQKKLMQLLTSTGDEKLLGQGLELNDNLQALLAKHDAIASGTFTPKSPPKQKMPALHPATNNQFEDDEEDNDDDEFAQIARRNTPNKSIAHGNTSPNGSSTSDASSSGASKALVLLDPPTPVKTRKDDQDMIDLLSLALTETTALPHRPLTPQSTSSQNGSPFPASSDGQDYLHGSQPSQINQGFTPYNSYVAPWAQPSLHSWQMQPPLQSQPTPYLSSYPSPPWTDGSSATNPFSTSTYQFPTSYANPATYSSLSGYGSIPLQRYTTFGPQYDIPTPAQRNANLRSLQSFNSFDTRVNNVVATDGGSVENTNLRPLQQYNSFGPSTNNNTATGGVSNSRKPYYHPDSLFGDLIDLKNKSPLSGTSGQSMVNGGN